MKRNHLILGLLVLPGLWFGLKPEETTSAVPSSPLEAPTFTAKVASAAPGPDITAEPARHLTPLPLKRPLIIDGFGDDWPTANGVNGDPAWLEAGDGIRYLSASDSEHIYLILDVQVDRPQFYQPANPQHPYEHIYLYWQQKQTLTTRLIRSIAPGSVQGYRSGHGQLEEDPAIQGSWEVTSAGYRLELRLPWLEEGSRLGLEVNRNGASLGNLGWQDDQLPLLRHPATALSALTRPK